MVSNLVYRVIRVSSSYDLMHNEFEFIRYITRINGYPCNFVECQIRHTLNRYFKKNQQKDIKSKLILVKSKKGLNNNNEIKSKDITNKKDKIIIDLPYVGKSTRKFTKEIGQISKQINPNMAIITVQKPPPKVGQLFSNKDKIPTYLQSDVVYQVKCLSCSASYIGQNRRQLKKRLKEHGQVQVEQEHNQDPQIQQQENLRRSSRLASKQNKKSTYDEIIVSTDMDDEAQTESVIAVSKNSSAIYKHMKENKHKIDWNNCKILDKEKHPYKLLIRETMAILEHKPILNQNTRSIPLVIYPDWHT